MTNYSSKVIDNLAKRVAPVIIEFKDNSVEVGHLAYDEFNILILYPLEASYYRCNSIIHRSYLKRVIHLGSGYVMPKEENGTGKILDIIEMNDLVNKAGYEYI